jgi:hypothetical protein
MTLLDTKFINIFKSLFFQILGKLELLFGMGL